MIKKNLKEAEEKNKASLELFLDKETIAIIEAQCEEHKTGRDRFIAVVIRLFLDFSYIARTVGKDIFSFRDEMIKAIVRSRGAGAGELIDKLNEAEKQASKKEAVKPPSDLNALKEKFSGIINEMSELKSAVLELKKSLAGFGPNVSATEQEADQIRSAEKKKDRHRPPAGETPPESKAEIITIDELASEFKSSAPPSYKDKRKKLNKLKF